MRWRKAAILGVGLLGGSLGLAMRRRGIAAEVSGLVRSAETRDRARSAGAVDHASDRLDSVLEGADLVVFCTPLSQMRPLAEGLAGRLEKGAVVTDVGSVKESVIEDLEQAVAGAGGAFVGSHPMAGSEKSGVGAARHDLFEGAVCIVTPSVRTDAEALGRVCRLWESVGSRVVTMPARKHDELVARSSHLPHLVAAALAHWILSPEHPPEQGALCAAGFRDTTRVASGSPGMWRDIAMANRHAILEAIRGLDRSLDDLREALEQGDPDRIEEYLRVARDRREAWRGDSASGE